MLDSDKQIDSTGICTGGFYQMFPRALSTLKVVLLGDQKQLGTVVKFQSLDKSALKVSLFERLWRALTGVPELDRPDLAALTDNPLAPRRGGLLG